MPDAAEVECDVVFIGGFDDFLIPHTSAGFDDEADPLFSCCVDAVAEREERFAGQQAPISEISWLDFFECALHRAFLQKQGF